jgi:hypothetical protein
MVGQRINHQLFAGSENDDDGKARRDRIIAMYQGRVMRTFTADDVTEDNLVQAISGIETDKTA